MKIKLLILLFFISFVIFSSCTKTVTKTITVTDTVTKTLTDTVIKYTTNNSTLFLFTEKQWIVDTVYANYSGANTGTLVYARGSNNNSQDYSTNRLVFWPDGSEDFFVNGTYGSYPWSFTGTDSTLLLIINTASDYARIITLNVNHLTLYDSTNSALVFYAFKP